MKKHVRVTFFWSSVVGLCAGLVSAPSGWAQTGFSESSMRAAHGLYAEGQAPRGTSFGRSGGLVTASYAGTSSASSSSSEEYSAAALEGLGDKGFSGVARANATTTRAMRPFETFAVAAKVGSGGIGVDVATVLAQRFNLRVGASYFSHDTSLTTDGLQITGAIKLQTAAASVDIFPFNNSFRISPGVSFKNDSHLSAALLVPGGQSFSLGDSDYTSDPADPIHGTAAFGFGRNVAPQVTVGFGNMIPRSGRRFSFPVEVGVQYTDRPTVNLQIAGSSCGSVSQDGVTATGCGPVDQISVQQEQQELRNDLAPLRFYPVISVGISYRIGGRRVY